MDTAELHIPDSSDGFGGQTSTDDQGSPSLPSQDINSVEGSYVSLLADIATIEKNEEIQNSESEPLESTNAEQVVYTPNEFTDEEELQSLAVTGMPATMNSEDFISYQNLTYTLTNPGESSADPGQHFIIVHPMQALFSVQQQTDSETVTQNENNPELSQISLEQSREFEEAVANIQDVDVDRIGASSFMVSTNNERIVEGIKIVPKSSNSLNLKTSTSRSTTKRKVAKKEKKELREYHFSNSLKKFRAEELDSNKSNAEIVSEYLEKAKQEVSRKTQTKDSKLEKAARKILVTTSSNTDNNSYVNSVENEMMQRNEEFSTNISGLSETADILQNICDESIGDTKSVTNNYSEPLEQVCKKEMFCADELIGIPVQLQEGTNDMTNTSHNFPTCSTNDLSQTKLNKSETCSLATKTILTRTSKRLVQKQSIDAERSSIQGHGQYTQAKRLMKVDSVKNIRHAKYKTKDKLVNEEEETDARFGDLCSIVESVDTILLSVSPVTLKTVSKKCLEIELDIFDDLDVSEVEKAIVSKGHTRYKFQISKPATHSSANTIESVRLRETIEVTIPKTKVQTTDTKKVINVNSCVSKIGENITPAAVSTVMSFEDNIAEADEDFDEGDTVENDKHKRDTISTSINDLINAGNQEIHKIKVESVADEQNDLCKNEIEDVPDNQPKDQDETALNDKAVEADIVEETEEADIQDDVQGKKFKEKKKKSYVVRIDEEGKCFIVTLIYLLEHVK